MPVFQRMDEVRNLCMTNPDIHAAIKFPVDAGILVRGAFKSWLQTASQYYGIQVIWTEEKYLLSTHFEVRMEGSAGKCQEALKVILRMSE